jgi:hypothetical protein
MERLTLAAGAGTSLEPLTQCLKDKKLLYPSINPSHN